jgi:hypothetical protein
MYQLTENAVSHLMDTSRDLHSNLAASPIWPMIKDEPIIVAWMNALREIEIEIKGKQVSPDEPKK